MKSLFTLLMILSLLSAASQAPCRLKVSANAEVPSGQLEWEPLDTTPSKLSPSLLLIAPLF